jgi:hypothetical protein
VRKYRHRSANTIDWQKPTTPASPKGNTKHALHDAGGRSGEPVGCLRRSIGAASDSTRTSPWSQPTVSWHSPMPQMDICMSSTEVFACALTRCTICHPTGRGFRSPIITTCFLGIHSQNPQALTADYSYNNAARHCSARPRGYSMQAAYHEASSSNSKHILARNNHHVHYCVCVKLT